MKVLETKRSVITSPYEQKKGKKKHQDHKGAQTTQFRNSEKLFSLNHIYQEDDKTYFLTNKSLNRSEITTRMDRMKEQKKKKEIILEVNKSNRKLDSKSLILKQNKNIPQINKLQCFFRYYPINIISACNQREEFMDQYLQGAISTFNSNIIVTSCNHEYYEKLKKAAKLKGKYRFREKHNPNYSVQLKSLNYKIVKKEAKIKKKQIQEQKEDSCEKIHQKKEIYKPKMKQIMCSRKRYEFPTDTKIFIIRRNYKDLKKCLLERGWKQNPDKSSRVYDFKWTYKISDNQYQSLHSNQIINHFKNTQSLTSKYGLCKSLRTIIYNENIDVDKFYPRCFDLADLSDFENFIQNYKWTFCESLLKQFIEVPNKFQNQIYKIKIAVQVTQRRLANLFQVLHQIKKKCFNICSIEEWAILTDTETKQEKIQHVLDKFHDGSEDLLKRTTQVLFKLKQKDPQFNINGFRNMWILKPNYLSRGRGIKCIVKLNQIFDYALGKNNYFVVQKYIQNPLLIMNRKFDIRQWVLVQDYNPPKIWFYEQCYLRFCTQQYKIDNINNKFMHLTNNAIQKCSKTYYNSQIQGNMWSMQEFSNYLDTTQKKENTWASIQKKIQDIVIWSIKSTEDQVYPRKNSFELFGYDFMIDEDLKPWLIEINTSPSMQYSTPITKKLVKMVMQDTVKVIIDSKNKKKVKDFNTGLFKCIYKGQQHRKNKYPVN